MARNRTIYQSEALFVSRDISSSLVADHKQLERVQSANYSFSVSRQDINQFGELARIDSLLIEPPTVNLDFSYYATDGSNERALGFYVQTGTAASGGFASGHLSTTSGKNFFISTTDEGVDLNKGGTVKTIIGVGNGFLSNYSLEAAVGSIPTVSVTIEGANICATGATPVSGGNSGLNPSVNPTNGTPLGGGAILPSGQSNLNTSSITALRAGDVTLSFSSMDSGVIAQLEGVDGMHIQSASLQIPLSRSPIQRLGTKFPYARTVELPATATLSVSAILNEITAENLAETLNKDVKSDLILTIKKPDQSGNALVYTLKNAKIDSQNFSSSIGANKTVELTFSTPIGGPNDVTNGVFVSGCGTGVVF